MRFTAVFVASALSAMAAAQSTSASPSHSIDPAQASVVACLDDCNDTDLECLARCNPVPNPTEDQVIKTDKCIGNCDQGDGSDEDSAAYAECQASCIADNYYNTSEGTPKPTGAAGGAGGSNGSGSNNGGSGSDDAQTTGTDSASGADSTDESSSNGGSGGSGSNNSNNDDEDSTNTDSESGSETGSAAGETESPDGAAQLAGSGAAVFAIAAALLAL